MLLLYNFISSTKGILLHEQLKLGRFKLIIYHFKYAADKKYIFFPNYVVLTQCGLKWSKTIVIKYLILWISLI